MGMVTMSKGTIISAALASAVFLGYCVVENRQLVTDEYDVSVKNLPDSFEGKKILHLSDLHKKRYGDGFNNLINSCDFCKPDYIFFTGDLFSRSEENLTPKLVLMQRLMKLAPVYYVMGNHEASPDAVDKAYALNCRLEREGVNVLINRCVKLTQGEDHVNLWGLALGSKYYKNSFGGYSGLPTVTSRTLTDLMGEPDKKECNILLAHTPMPFAEYAKWGADLTFSGHCHGGIIRLPIVGGLLSPERRFFPKYTKGVYTLDEASMVVSAGLGKFRLQNPAQMICVTLHKQSQTAD